MTTTTTTALNLQLHLLRAALLVLCCSAVSLACHGKLLVSGITEAEKTVILQEHNKLRQMVATGRYPGQPAAENMREIVWDDELAARAQKWADNCQFRHDPHRTINRFTMGQNLAIIWSTAPLDPDDGDFPSRIQSWFNEVQKYSFGDAWSPKTGHYSQLVWGETSLVGCGFAEYKDTTKYNKLYVCNYGPGGNVVGYNPYEVGKPSCATYGLRPSSRYPGLCAAPGASANSISSNTIDTYEYTQSNAFNNQQNAYGTQYLQQASSSYPQQASPPRAQPTPAAPAPAPAPAAAAPAAPASAGGSSYGSKGYGGSVAFTTEASQYGGSGGGGSRYKNKLEAYKPSPAEFEKSVRKHTILRTYLNQGQGQGQGQGLGQAETPRPEAPTVTTPKPAKRGWSLLTWRG